MSKVLNLGKVSAAGLVVLCLSGGGRAIAQDRLPTIPPAKYDEVQKKAAEEFLAARKVPVFGPFEPLMHSPEVMTVARQMGDYLRYKSAIGTTLSELVILVTSREWGQDYEWHVHAPIALKQGIKKEIVDAIAEGRRPASMSEEEEICYEFSTELHRNKRVSDMTYDRAVKRFGEKGVVDLAAINGYYTFLAMAMNTSRMRVPPNGLKLPRFPD
jgi:4-carboxymuconolactone decarboxylase